MIADIEGQALLEEAISEQLQKEASVPKLDKEDEALFAELYKEETPSSEKKPEEVTV